MVELLKELAKPRYFGDTIGNDTIFRISTGA
jgi:hypothetical protein